VGGGGGGGGGDNQNSWYQNFLVPNFFEGLKGRKVSVVSKKNVFYIGSVKMNHAIIFRVFSAFDDLK